jgi:N-acetylmuramoyl-L-alanine amidase
LTKPAVLRPGSRGEAVRDLQVRLGASGHEIPQVETGSYGPATERVVRRFQEARGLRVDGICGPQTWAAIVESGWRLGDRLLYRRRPMLRGDDVAELQRRLNGLGFDAGREDGILGDDTTRALVEFQRNMNLPTDGMCGAATLAVLERVGTLAEGSVASVREREALRRGPHRLSGRRVFVAAAPGFETLASVVVRELAELGAGAALDATGADDPVLAAEANRYAADLFLAFRAGDAPGCRCSYFASGRFRSEGGYAVAEAVSQELAPILGGDPCAAGRTYAVLRETRMAAVICEPVAQADIDAMRALVVRSADVAHAVVRGVRRGVEQPPPAAQDDDT